MKLTILMTKESLRMRIVIWTGSTWVLLKLPFQFHLILLMTLVIEILVILMLDQIV